MRVCEQPGCPEPVEPPFRWCKTHRSAEREARSLADEAGSILDDWREDAARRLLRGQFDARAQSEAEHTESRLHMLADAMRSMAPASIRHHSTAEKQRSAGRKGGRPGKVEDATVYDEIEAMRAESRLSVTGACDRLAERRREDGRVVHASTLYRAYRREEARRKK